MKTNHNPSGARGGFRRRRRDAMNNATVYDNEKRTRREVTKVMG